MNLAHSLGCRWSARPGTHMQACQTRGQTCVVPHCCQVCCTQTPLLLEAVVPKPLHGTRRRLALPLRAARALRCNLGRWHAGAARCPRWCARRWRRRTLRRRSVCGCTTWRRSRALGAQIRGKGVGMGLARCGSPCELVALGFAEPGGCYGVRPLGTH